MENTLKSLVGDLVPAPETPVVVVEETPKPEVKVEQTGSVPLPVFMEMKHEFSDLRRENAELRLRFDQLQRPEVAVQTETIDDPDPLQVHIDKYTKDFIDENGHAPELSDIPVSADIYLARDKWREDIARKDQERQAIDIRKHAIHVASTQTMTEQSFGPDLGLDSVVAIGNKYLTQGDKLDISQAGDQCAVVMYRKCLERAVQSGTPEGKALAARVQAKFQESDATPESLAEIKTPIDKEAVLTKTPPASAEEAIGRYPHLARLGLKGHGRTA